MGIHLMPPLYMKVIKLPLTLAAIEDISSSGTLDRTAADTYLNVRAASDATQKSQTLDYIYPGQAWDAAVSKYSVYRGVLFFDTSSLAGLSVIAGRLRLYCVAKNVDHAWDLVVVDGSPVHDPFQNADYGLLLSETTSLGKVSNTEFTDGEWTLLKLNAGGIALIDKTGTTQFALRSSDDIDGIAPTTLRDDLFIGAVGSLAVYHAELIVDIEV